MPKLSLSMIVKNEEKFLRDCLESVKGVVDEIVIVDTGSTDETLKIAEKFGAKVFKFDWINDFAAARNYALSKITGEWVLYLDADERLDSNSIPEIKKYISSKSLTAYYCTVKSYDSGEGRDNTLRYTRFFANHPGLNFTGKVHEQIEASLNNFKYKICDSDILIHHIGYDISREEKQKKASRNLTLLQEEYESTQSSYDAFQLAQTYMILDDKESARRYFILAGESRDLDEALRAECYSSLSYLAHNDFNGPESEKYIQLAIKLDPSKPYSQLLAAKIALRNGQSADAEIRCKAAIQLNNKILAGKSKSKLTVLLDPEEVIYFGLSVAVQTQNSINAGFYRKELNSYYNRKECKQGGLKNTTITRLFSGSVLSHSEENMFVEMTNIYNLNLFLNVLLSNPDKEQILRLVNTLLEKFPEETEIKKMIARVLNDLGRTEEAVLILENALIRNHTDPAMLFYLISFYVKTGDLAKIKPVVEKLSEDFSNIPEVMQRVNALRLKLNL